MGGIDWVAVSAIGSLLGAAVGAVHAFKAPKISIPNISLPQEDWNKINAAIEANKSLSDAARQSIQQALTLYNQGQLTPYYQAKLDEWWRQASTSLEQTLAAQGLSNSTIADAARRDILSKYTQTYGDLLTKQLSDALQLTGISQEYYNELMQKSQLQLNQSLAQAKLDLTGQYLRYDIKQQQMAGFGNILQSASMAAGSLGGSKASTQTPQITLGQGLTQVPTGISYNFEEGKFVRNFGIL